MFGNGYFSHGKWRWVPASERCTGRPCFCDLQLGSDEVRAVIAHHGVRSAAEAQRLVSAIEDERHERRRYEREAMSAADEGGLRHQQGIDDELYLAGPSERKRARITAEPIMTEAQCTRKRTSVDRSRIDSAAQAVAPSLCEGPLNVKRMRRDEPSAGEASESCSTRPFSSRAELLNDLQRAAPGRLARPPSGEREPSRKRGNETQAVRSDDNVEGIGGDGGGMFSSRKALLHALRLRDRAKRE